MQIAWNHSAICPPRFCPSYLEFECPRKIALHESRLTELAKGTYRTGDEHNWQKDRTQKNVRAHLSAFDISALDLIGLLVPIDGIRWPPSNPSTDLI